MEWTTKMVVDPSGAQHEFPSTGDAGSPYWHWDPRKTTYHFPSISVDYNLEGIIDLAIKHAPPLGEFRLAPMANQLLGKLLGLSWYDNCTRGLRTISILWQEFVGGGGIGRPPHSALYGARDSSHLCET